MELRQASVKDAAEGDLSSADAYSQWKIEPKNGKGTGKVNSHVVQGGSNTMADQVFLDTFAISAEM